MRSGVNSNNRDLGGNQHSWRYHGSFDCDGNDTLIKKFTSWVPIFCGANFAPEGAVHILITAT